MAHFLRRGTIGVAGLIASIALVSTLHNLVLGLVLGAAIGAVHSIMSRATPFAYAESIFTAGTLGILLWFFSSFSESSLPAPMGGAPTPRRWEAQASTKIVPFFQLLRGVFQVSGGIHFLVSR